MEIWKDAKMVAKKRIDKDAALAAAFGELMTGADAGGPAPAPRKAAGAEAAPERGEGAEKRTRQLTVFVTESLYRKLKMTAGMAAVTPGFKDVATITGIVTASIEEYFENHRRELEDDLGVRL